MGLGETLVAGVAGELLRRGRAPHLVAADATAGFVPGNLGRRAWPTGCSNGRRAVLTALI
jgi:hypothetical protein